MRKIIPLLAVIKIVAACKKNSVPALVNESSSMSADIAQINDPSIYPSVQIGPRIWMTKNLSVNFYRNGDTIPQVKDPAKWAALTTGAWCWYNNDSATYAVYGKLYNWYAVNDPRGLAPKKWHIPSDTEWNMLSTYVGGDGVGGGRLKEAGLAHWLPPNTDATNSSRFTGLPGGYREIINWTFNYVGYFGYWWSATPVTTTLVWCRKLHYATGSIYPESYYKAYGLSVRCVKN